jgi:peptidoglycan hydrolase-like protein with peptidoglycan-binding domain
MIIEGPLALRYKYVCGKRMMRDVLDDDERKLKPVSVLMITTAAVLGGMIVYNAMFAQSAANQARQLAAVPPGATTRMKVTVPATDANTVVFKYDPAVEEAQRELLAVGVFKGMVDGVNGQKTKMAVQQYQQANGMPVTGEVTPELINHIKYTHKVQVASEFTGSIDAAPGKIDAPTSVAATVSPNEPATIVKVQTALAQRGYDIGESTGRLDAATKAAILQFEMDNGLAMDGAIDLQLLAALMKTSAGQSASGN